MTLSMLLYALMVSTLVVLVGVLVLDALRARARRRRTLEDRHQRHGSGPLALAISAVHGRAVGRPQRYVGRASAHVLLRPLTGW
jgi:hypothetical protein